MTPVSTMACMGCVGSGAVEEAIGDAGLHWQRRAEADGTRSRETAG
jgi:hypothetical protein